MVVSIDQVPLNHPDWAAVLTAGMAAQGRPVTVSCAAPTTCDCAEWVCPDGTHLWCVNTPQTGAPAREAT